MKQDRAWLSALKSAFPYTIPILTGFLFLGAAYGIFMNVSGFGAFYSILISLIVFAGSMQFVAVNLLIGAFDPVGALLLTLMVNARHLFYGLSMLDKYKNVKHRRFYLIFALCDETFSANCTARIPETVDKDWFYFWTSFLDQCYWVIGTAIGGLFGSFLTFNTEGLDFVMTALLVVIFLENWLKEKNHTSSILGLVLSLICLLLFGSSSFIIPSMIAILGILTLIRKPLSKAGENA